MLTSLFLFRACFMRYRYEVVDYEDMNTLKKMDPINCYLCNYSTDMLPKEKYNQLERHRQCHHDCFNSE